MTRPDFNRRAAETAVAFALLAGVGLALLTVRFGVAYLLLGITLAFAFVAIDLWAKRRRGSISALTFTGSTRRFVARDIILPAGLFVVGTAIGAALLGAVDTRMAGVLIAFNTAGAVSFATIAWLSRRPSIATP